jgi:hypothetical protein
MKKEGRERGVWGSLAKLVRDSGTEEHEKTDLMGME